MAKYRGILASVKGSNAQRKAATMDSTRINMIARSVYESYTGGILALGTVTMVGITINLTVNGYTDWNRLEITGNNKIATVAIYDNDSDDAQFATILDIVDFILR